MTRTKTKDECERKYWFKRESVASIFLDHEYEALSTFDFTSQSFNRQSGILGSGIDNQLVDDFFRKSKKPFPNHLQKKNVRVFQESSSGEFVDCFE